MSNLNSWEEDPAAQDDNNLSRQTQQMNLNNQPQPQANAFRPGAATFHPGAQSFQPGQPFATGGGAGGGGGYMPQYYGGQGGYYPQYGGGAGGQGGFDQYGQGYGNVYGQQGRYNNQQGYQGYGMVLDTPRSFIYPFERVLLTRPRPIWPVPAAAAAAISAATTTATAKAQAATEELSNSIRPYYCEAANC